MAHPGKKPVKPGRPPKRRGRYAKTIDRIQGEPPVWGPEDDALYTRSLEQSVVKHDVGGEALARGYVQQEIRIRGLMQLTVRNADEEKALNQADALRLKYLAALKLIQEEKDDPEEDGDDA